ncbi:hypothetical protein [Mycolicibacterium tokaiense]|nr:hypothetical protein [Mycolicibacterium tokaiense]
MQSDPDTGHHAEVASAAAQSPEQFRFVIGVGHHDRSIREHDFR